jgi:hypothetical protein
MNGYIAGQVDSEKYAQNDPYRGFSQWVADRFRISTTHNWPSIVEFMANSESAAFEMTKELWLEYRSSQE